MKFMESQSRLRLYNFHNFPSASKDAGRQSYRKFHDLTSRKTRGNDENLRLRHMLQHNKLQRSHRGYSRPRRSWQQSRRLQSESTLCYWTFDYYPFLQTTKSENVMKKSPNASRRYAKSGNVSNPERDPSNKG